MAIAMAIVWRGEGGQSQMGVQRVTHSVLT